MDYNASRTALGKLPGVTLYDGKGGVENTPTAVPGSGDQYQNWSGSRADETGYGGGTGGGAGAYAARTNELALQHGQDRANRQYQQYVGAEGFRRNREDAGLQIKRTFPKVGSAFNRRGMWNSGLRKQGQNQFVGDYKRDVGRTNWDQGRYDQGYALQQTQADAGYQSALQQAFDDFQTKRTQTDPYAAIRSNGL